MIYMMQFLKTFKVKYVTHLIGIQRFRNLVVSEFLYNIIKVGGLNLTPNFKTVTSCDIVKKLCFALNLLQRS